MSFNNNLTILEIGARSIREHPWMKNVNWNALLQQLIKPPFIPITKGDLDTSNFDKVIIFKR